MKVSISGQKIAYEGNYEYTEGGIEKNDKPGFHISFGSETEGRSSCEIYFIFENMKEFDEFISDVVNQIKNFKKMINRFKDLK